MKSNVSATFNPLGLNPQEFSNRDQIIDRVITSISNNRAIFVFDVDNTLSHSEPTLHANFSAVAKARGFKGELDWAELNGKGDNNAYTWLHQQEPNFETPDFDAFMGDYVDRNLESDFKAIPEMLSLFTKLQNTQKPIGIYTSALKAVAYNTLRRAGYKDIENIPFLSGHEIPGHKKPDPKGYLDILNAIVTQDTHCQMMRIAFEDSPSGATSALGAAYHTFHIVHKEDHMMGFDELDKIRPRTGQSYIPVSIQELPLITQKIESAVDQSMKVAIFPQRALKR